MLIAAMLAISSASAQQQRATDQQRTLVASIRADSAELVFAGPTLILPGGMLAVADLPTLRVLVLDTLGRRVEALGGEGRAPGLLLALDAMGTLGDSILWVTDGNNRRLERWRLPSLRYDSGSPLEPLTATGIKGTNWAVFSLGPNGSALLVEQTRGPEHPERRRPSRLVRRSSDGRTSVLGSYSWGPQSLSLADGRVMTAFQPFSDNPLYIRSGTGRRTFVVQRRPTADKRIRLSWHDLVNGSTDSASLDLRVTPLSRRIVDSTATAFAENVWQSAGYPSARAALADIRKGLYVPATRPAVGRAVADRNGNSIWLESVGLASSGTDWLEFDVPQRRIARRVRLLPGEAMLAADGSVIWTAAEQDDGEFAIQRHLLNPVAETRGKGHKR